MILLLILLVFTWDPVTTNENGEPITVSHYALYKRKVGTEWPVKPFATRKGTTYTMSVVPKYPFEVAVTAVVVTQYESKKSNVVEVKQ